MSNQERNGQDNFTCDEATGTDDRFVPLGTLEIGQKATIRRLSCDRKLRRRLMDMGVVAGTDIVVERVAPLGDPMDLLVKGFHLSLRKEEAGGIWVELRGDE